MLGKLLKYEFGATGRKFLPLYLAILIVSLFLNFSIRFPGMELMLTLSGLVLFSLFVALAVITLMTIINRFKNNLLSDEGYLMFTLPVSTENLIFSKLISAIVWIIFSGIISIFSAMLIFANKEFLEAAKDALSHIREFSILFQGNFTTWLILGGICLLTQIMYFILLIYASLSVSQIAAFNKHRGLVSFAAFILINTVLNSVISVLFKNIFGGNPMNNIDVVTPILVFAIGTNFVLSVLMFFGTYYLLKNHLNIE